MSKETSAPVEAGVQAGAAKVEEDATTDFALSATESELLEEFGVLLAAEYNYATAI